MSKKFKVAVLTAILVTFMFTLTAVSYAAGTGNSSSQSFKPYKAVVTAGSLNIRETPSASGKVVGSYKKGTIVDVIGQSGTFLKTSKGYISSAYTRKYTTAAVQPSSAFASYKAVITSSYLNIRQAPSVSSKIMGKYYKGNVVDVIGTSGSFLKTSKGYIAAAYTQKYVQPVPQPSTPPLYRVKIIASMLSIRQEASTSSKELGRYYRGDVVDIFGQSGDFLKTSKGYIYASYTQKIELTSSRGDESQSPYAGKYISVNEDTQLLLNTDGTPDERYAVKGKIFKIIDEVNGYFKVKMGSIYGYIKQDRVTILDTAPQTRFTLGWNYIYQKASNKICYDDSSDYVNRSSVSLGMDAISPTWFYVSGDTKNPGDIRVSEKADREYVTRAHRNGYEVHALFSEFSSDRAYTMFNNADARKRVIDQVLEYALQYNVDGINIDFEALGSRNKAGFTAFVRDLSERLKQAGLTVSVDVTKITTDSNVWSGGYDRLALSQYADYVMLMAYDEHYAGSKEAGSVGSYPWVNASIKQLLDLGIPSDKLILGVPFYLRDYKISVSTAFKAVVFNNDQSGVYSQPVLDDSNRLENASSGGSYEFISLQDGWYKVRYNDTEAYIPEDDATVITFGSDSSGVVGSSAIKMQTAIDNRTKYNGTVRYDDTAKQNVLEYCDSNGYKHAVWLEDASSMAWRMDLVNSYSLKGAAAWSLGFETPDIWDIIKQKLK